ncbi:4Fe-4S dicluster domain-containing protein [Marinigracilibium pacificum]|uniref:4Fe-4S dicluster domain-containing protein n=1 Tax=Marinigracilibium pacificum TaxID=2729599 RepID=A0A848J3Q0_9BACT|nr:4Fe-4S dicluster domain-containing protein [Marinigracilibium pacificum]NMM48979.1 4Fe-4S dicluster domain-containing protein [Marinigracilibium pacificum]
MKKKGANNTYFGNISEAFDTLINGLKTTWKHIPTATKKRSEENVDSEKYFEKQEGLFTVQYPRFEMPVPEKGRYKLHNEIEDCIVCDKCAKVCPVDCIDIEPVKAVEEIGKTSDGTTKRIHAAKFDIDMAKCCFCGLCTTVCPTECLTMTPEYDYSTFKITDHNFPFSKMTEQEIANAKADLDKALAEKAAKSEPRQVASDSDASSSEEKQPAKPKMGKPKFRPKPMNRKKDDNNNTDN